MKKLLFVIGILFSAIAVRAQCIPTCLQPVDITLDANGEFLFTPDMVLVGDYTGCSLEVALLDAATNQVVIPLAANMLLDCSLLGDYVVQGQVVGGDYCLATLIINEGPNGCQVNIPPDTYAMNFTKRNFGATIGTDGMLNGNSITQYYDWLWFLPEADLVSGLNTITFPPATNSIPLSGVSSLDIVIGQRMIIDTVYYPLRAVLTDVDDSGYLGINDLLLIRQFILGIISSLPASNYLFISKTYSFPSNFDPFDFTALNFREYSFDDATVTDADLNFNVYMMGNSNEVTDSIGGSISVASRSNKELEIEDRLVTDGETISVPMSISGDDIDINGLQFSLEMQGLSLVSVSHNYSSEQFGYNKVSNQDNRFLFTDYDGLEELEMTLELAVTQDGNLSEMITIASTLDAFLTSYNQQANIDLVFRTTSSTDEVLDLNTSLLSSQIVIDLPIGHRNAVNVYGMDGRLVQQYEVNQNQVIINRSDLTASGMYFISTQLKDKLVTKKIVAL